MHAQVSTDHIFTVDSVVGDLGMKHHETILLPSLEAENAIDNDFALHYADLNFVSYISVTYDNNVKNNLFTKVGFTLQIVFRLFGYFSPA